MARHGVNVLLPGKVLQRGSILRWKRDEKRRFMMENKIGVVYNFWEKVDQDMEDVGLDFYHYCPARFADMMTPKMEMAASHAAEYLRQPGSRAILSLCEAGVTRSVFFAVLVCARYNDRSLQDAWEAVQEAMNKKARLRPEMLSYIEREGKPEQGGLL